MASELIVQTLKGPTSGANANKVIIPSGQTLDINEWSPPAGTVVQVVQSTDGTETNITTDATWTDTGLSASITPSSASNKIYVNAQVAMQYAGLSGDGDSFWGAGRILQGSTSLWTPGTSTLEIGFNTRSGLASVEAAHRATWLYLDSPSTTSEVTYKIQLYIRNGYGNGFLLNSRGTISTIILMEIAG